MTFAHTRTHRLEKGLWLVERRGRRHYTAQGYAGRRLHYQNLQTADYRAAEQAALKWFRTLRSATEPDGKTMGAAMEAYLESIHDAAKRAYHAKQWHMGREYWQPGMGRPPIYVRDVTPPVLAAFVTWRRKRNPSISASSIRKALVTIRQALKYAVSRGVIPTLPLFPGAHIIGSVPANPRPWLTPDEWAHLQRVAEQRIIDAPNARTKAQRQELLYVCRLMVGTGVRVDEARGLQVRDVRVKVHRVYHTEGSMQFDEHGEVTNPHEIEVTFDETRYLELTIRVSKSGPRVAVSRSIAVEPFERLAAGKRPNDRLITEHHRDAFRELLEAAGLRENAFGVRRNMKSLRPTAIMHWLIAHPAINLRWLASNVGTSLQMIDAFYASKLGPQTMDPGVWV
jgi:integrase